MMYASKFAAAVKVAGKVLREHGDTVYLPFGSEYSILLKNLSTVRAQARISIDGNDVLNGDSLVINPNSDLELERFLKDKDRGNRFKFIERTQAVEDHRGVKVEDGIIRIEYQFEYVWPSGTICKGSPITWRNPGFPDDIYGARRISYDSNVSNHSLLSSNSIQYSSFSASAAPATPPVNETGITAPGSISDQKFQEVSNFILEAQKHVLVLRLLGETGKGNKIVEVITVKHKPKCVSCGKVNKANSKFCSECGTGLEVV